MMAQRLYGFCMGEVVPYFQAPQKKALITQFHEVRLLWKKYHFPPYHYFKHRLYEASCTGDTIDYVPPIVIERFQRDSNPVSHMRMLFDKLETNKILGTRGLPCIATILEIDADGVIRTGTGNLMAADQACMLLRQLGGEVFVKPIDAGSGVGAHPIAASELTAEWFEGQRKVVVQPLIRNHPDIQQMHPHCLNTVRIDVLNEASESVVNAACLKIGMGDLTVDNWSRGAIAVGVDLRSGRLAKRGVRKAKYGRLLPEAHPDSGIRFADIVLPFWPETLALAKAAADALRPHVTLGLDIAITPTGPFFVEANETGSIFLLQEAFGPLGATRVAACALEHWERSHGRSPA